MAHKRGWKIRKRGKPRVAGLGLGAFAAWIVLDVEPVKTAEIASLCGLSLRVAQQALRALRGAGLAVPAGRSGWLRAPGADLVEAARKRGTLGAYELQRAQYERERREFRNAEVAEDFFAGVGQRVKVARDASSRVATDDT